MTVKEILNQIEDDDLYMALHEAKGHALSEHVILREDLPGKLLSTPKPKNPYDMKLATRFFSKEEALIFIRKALRNHQEEIEHWVSSDVETFLRIEEMFEGITGEGIAYHTDWKNRFQLHGVLVLLHRCPEHLFYVKTAYPYAAFDDVDPILDAMEAYERK